MILVKSIFHSMFSRREVKIFLAFSFLPMLVPILSDVMDGINADLANNFLSFLDSAITTQSRLILPTLLFSLIISSVFKEEIESGIMFLYKDINRNKIFNAKLISLMLIYFLYFLLTVLVSVIAYYGFMLPQGNALPNFISEKAQNIVFDLFSLLANITLNIITIILVSTVSITSKNIQSVLTGVLFTLAYSVAPALIGIRYIFPNGYTQLTKTNLILAVASATVLSGAFLIFWIGENQKIYAHSERSSMTRVLEKMSKLVSLSKDFIYNIRYKGRKYVPSS